jgi:hypothetical protein
MIFRPDLAAAVVAGTKTVTRRRVSPNPSSPWFGGRCGYRVGQDVAICPGRGRHAVGRATIVGLSREPLGMLTRREAAAEGFASAEAFEEAWSAIHGGYDAGAVVWRVELRPVAAA